MKYLIDIGLAFFAVSIAFALFLICSGLAHADTRITMKDGTVALVSGDMVKLEIVPAPPVIVPSPDGSTIPPLTQLLDLKLNKWTVASGVVQMNGANAGFSANVILLLYFKGVIYQKNSAGGWWSWTNSTWLASSDPRPPAPAALAGYNTLTFGPNIILGQNWLLDRQNGTTANVVQNADGSVTVAGGGDTWNGQLETYLNGQGTAFGGGFYTQATVVVPGPTSGLSPWTGGTDGNQWPSFWANSVNGTIETDFMEMMGPTPGEYGATLINWTTNPQQGFGQSIYAPSGNTLHGPNDFGFLWIPATATTSGSMAFYLNGLQVGIPVTWTQSNPGMYGIIDGQQMVLRMGAGDNSPATFSNVQVWQK